MVHSIQFYCQCALYAFSYLHNSMLAQKKECIFNLSSKIRMEEGGHWWGMPITGFLYSLPSTFWDMFTLNSMSVIHGASPQWIQTVATYTNQPSWAAAVHVPRTTLHPNVFLQNLPNIEITY